MFGDPDTFTVWTVVFKLMQKLNLENFKTFWLCIFYFSSLKLKLICQAFIAPTLVKQFSIETDFLEASKFSLKLFKDCQIKTRYAITNWVSQITNCRKLDLFFQRYSRSWWDRGRRGGDAVLTSLFWNLIWH